MAAAESLSGVAALEDLEADVVEGFGVGLLLGEGDDNRAEALTIQGAGPGEINEALWVASVVI